MTREDSSNPRRQEWQARREEILAAAIELIAERGYGGTTMQDIASRVGCSVGYLYRHFDSKLALAGVLVDREIGRVEQISARVHELDLPPLAAYRLLLEELSRYLVDRRPLVRVFTREAVLRLIPEADLRIRSFRDPDRRLFEKALAAGEIENVDPDLLAVVLQSVVDALMSHLAEQDEPGALLRLPDIVFCLIIDPLRPPTQQTGTHEEGHHGQRT